MLTLWTADPALAADADAAGVDRVGLDLERIGKGDRQPATDFWHSDHDESQLPAVAGALRHAQLFVRCNPLHPGWSAEIERLLAAQAEVIMLPAFRSADDVRQALEVIAGRALLVPLLELPQALGEVERILERPGLVEVHFGLNDLALAWGLGNRFEALLRPELERACAALRAAGLRFGIGGVGRLDDRSLPIPSEPIYARYVALGATSTLLARSFSAGLSRSNRRAELSAAVAVTRAGLASWSTASSQELDRQRQALVQALANGREA